MPREIGGIFERRVVTVVTLLRVVPRGISDIPAVIRGSFARLSAVTPRGGKRSRIAGWRESGRWGFRRVIRLRRRINRGRLRGCSGLRIGVSRGNCGGKRSRFFRLGLSRGNGGSFRGGRWLRFGFLGRFGLLFGSYICGVGGNFPAIVIGGIGSRGVRGLVGRVGGIGFWGVAAVRVIWRVIPVPRGLVAVAVGVALIGVRGVGRVFGLWVFGTV